MSEAEQAGVPLVVGVTGHRDLCEDELPLLKQAVQHFLSGLSDQFPGLPVEVISPLAEGADQLVADVALSMGMSVTALLPMPIAEYEKDFDGDALVEFRRLAAQSDLLELPLLGTRDVSVDSDARDLQYVEVGGFLAAHCHVLLAVWDGKDSHWPGGTSKVIRFHQQDTMDSLPEGNWLTPVNFTDDESDLVYHVACSRQSGEEKLNASEAGKGRWLTRDAINPTSEEMPERYVTVFRRLVEYNEDARDVPTGLPSYLVPDELLEAAGRRVGRIVDQFVAADYLAQVYQKKMFRVVNSGFVLLILAGISFITYADLLNSDLMIYAYLGFVTATFVMFSIERRSGWRRKYQDYRVLAEALRVQFYWSLAGVMPERPFNYCHDSFHERRDLELGWIRHVMRYSGRRADAIPEDDGTALEAVVNYWVIDENLGQRSYYLSKTRQRTSRQKIARTLEAGAFVMVIAIALMLVFLPMAEGLSSFMIACVGLLPFLIAVRQNHAFQTAERELITQYSYYYQIFSNAQRLIEFSDDLVGKRNILRALGEAALDENSQWILRQRERPLTNTLIGA